jgi:hypothetical protein
MYTAEEAAEDFESAQSDRSRAYTMNHAVEMSLIANRSKTLLSKQLMDKQQQVNVLVVNSSFESEFKSLTLRQVFY